MSAEDVDVLVRTRQPQLRHALRAAEPGVVTRVGVVPGGIPLDAIPDLSDPQVIVFTEWMGPLAHAGRGPGHLPDHQRPPGRAEGRGVRGFSMFGMSFVYVIFEEGTDLYWARSPRARVPEHRPQPPARGRHPDASARRHRHRLGVRVRPGRPQPAARPRRAACAPGLHAALRPRERARRRGGRQRRRLREAVPGHRRPGPPARLRPDGRDVSARIRRSNAEVGGRVSSCPARVLHPRPRLHRRLGRTSRRSSIRAGAVGHAGPVRDVATVRIGPEHPPRPRRARRPGRGGRAIVVARYGENALDVIERVKEKLAALKTSLPRASRSCRPTTARLIERAIDTLQHALIEEGVVVALVILLFLLHLRSALLPILSPPAGGAASFIPMYLLGIPATIMSSAASPSPSAPPSTPRS
jgi:Cu(I)/Ag(I) efflux system membrane protein CusA/SilA